MNHDDCKIQLTLSSDGHQAQLSLRQQSWQLSIRPEGDNLTITDWEGPEPDAGQLYALLDRLFFHFDPERVTLRHALAARWPLTHPAWQQTDTGDYRLDRPGLYQVREAWLAPSLLPVMPEVPTRTGDVEHPRRPVLGDGILYRRYHPGLDRVLELRQATVAEDGERFHRWQNLPRVARFWEYPYSRERLDAMLVERRNDPNSRPLILQADGDPVGYFEAYYVPEDRLGPYCQAGPFDQGVHLLIGEERYCGNGQTTIWLNTLSHFLFLLEPRTRALYGEPDEQNHAIFRQLKRTTWQCHHSFDFPHKRSVLVTNERTRFFRETRL